MLSQLPPRWVLYFAALAVLGAVAVAVPAVYNARQQLRAEDLHAARQRWRERGLRDYDLHLLHRIDRGPRFHQGEVAVRGDRVVGMRWDGEVYLPREVQGPLGLAVGGSLRAFAPKTPTPEVLEAHTVDGLFRRMEEDLRANVQGGGWDYITAAFDAATGAPVRYVYRVRGSGERREWHIKVEPRGPVR